MTTCTATLVAVLPLALLSWAGCLLVVLAVVSGWVRRWAK